MSLLLAVSLLSSTVIGYLVSKVFLPASTPKWADFLINLSLGSGIGVGLTSCLYFVLRLLAGPSTGAYVIGELFLLLTACTVWWFARNNEQVHNLHSRPVGWFWALLVGLVAAVAIAVPLFVDGTRSNPYGGWDAWAIWNLRAKLLAQ